MTIGELKALLSLSSYRDDGEVIIEIDGEYVTVDRSYPMHTNDFVLKVRI